jgi:hypothetical protein
LTAGHSKKPLAAKLGIKTGFRISLVNYPDNYLALLGQLPPGVQLADERAVDLDFIHLFAAERRLLGYGFAQARRRIKPDGMLWVSWPKQTSALKGDLKENIVREIGLANSLVDVKVAAIDDDWSGLKFVYRLKDRL